MRDSSHCWGNLTDNIINYDRKCLSFGPEELRETMLIGQIGMELDIVIVVYIGLEKVIRQLMSLNPLEM